MRSDRRELLKLVHAIIVHRGTDHAFLIAVLL